MIKIKAKGKVSGVVHSCNAIKNKVWDRKYNLSMKITGKRSIFGRKDTKISSGCGKLFGFTRRKCKRNFLGTLKYDGN